MLSKACMRNDFITSYRNTFFHNVLLCSSECRESDITNFLMRTIELVVRHFRISHQILQNDHMIPPYIRKIRHFFRYGMFEVLTIIRISN